MELLIVIGVCVVISIPLAIDMMQEVVEKPVPSPTPKPTTQKVNLLGVHPLVYLIVGIMLTLIAAGISAMNLQSSILDIVLGGMSAFGFFCLIIMVPITSCVRIVRWDQNRKK